MHELELCDEVGVTDVPRIDKRLRAMDTININSMKVLAHQDLRKSSTKPAAVPRAQTQSPAISIKPSDTHGGNVSVGVDIDIGELRSLNSST